MVSIIIVNYNTGEILRDCVESVIKFEKDIEYEIIIVDNNSTDNSREIIEHLKIGHTYISSIYIDGKKSFSYANNLGFDSSRDEYILIMNPDIIFTKPVLKGLINEFKEQNSLGALCPLLIGTDGKFQRNYYQRYPTIRQFIFFYSFFAKFFMNSKKLLNKYLENGDIDINSDKLQYVQQIPCAFFLTTREVFVKAGKMDASYELFFEDVDLSYQVNKFKKIGVHSGYKVTHLGGSSFKTSDDYWLYGRFILSMIHFFEKNYSNSGTNLLKSLTLTNSYFILFLEKIKSMLGKADDYRKRKHENFLKEYKRTYS